MVFYAYTLPKDRENDWRYLITASSVEIVDQWFRLSREDGLGVERKSPDLYLYTWAGGVYPWKMVNDPTKTAAKVRGQIFFTRFDPDGGYRQMVFPNQFAPDHISDKAFFIRSKSNPNVFWTLDGNTVKASKHSRTKFQISNPNKPNQVMLPDDPITINVVDGARGVDGSVQGQLSAPLTTTSNNSNSQGWKGFSRGDFIFSDFKNKFLSNAIESDPTPHDDVMFVPYHGEEWELVL